MKPILVGWEDSFVQKSAKASFLLSLAILALVGVLFNRLPPEVPLFYSRPWGEDQIVSRPTLFLVPSAALVFSLLSVFISRFFEKNILLLRLLWSGCLVAAFLGAITVLRIILLVW